MSGCDLIGISTKRRHGDLPKTEDPAAKDLGRPEAVLSWLRPLKRAEGLERRRSSALQLGSPALSHSGFSVAKSAGLCRVEHAVAELVEMSRSRWRRRNVGGAVVTPVAAVRWLERCREVSGAVAKWLDAFQKAAETSRILRRRCKSSGDVANSEEASRIFKICREMPGDVTYPLEALQIMRRRRKLAGDVAKSRELSQKPGTLRRIGRRCSASGAAERVDVECRDRNRVMAAAIRRAAAIRDGFATAG
jgi:hypothetical protein